MQPVYQTPSQAHDEPASSRSQGGDVEISDAVDDKKHLDTEKHDLKTQVAKVKAKVAKVEAKVAEVEAKVAEVEGEMKLIVNFVKGHATVSDLNKGVESLRGWDESDRAGEPREPSDRLLSRYESLEDEKKSLKEEKKSLNQQLVAFQNQLVEFQKRLTLLAQAPPEMPRSFHLAVQIPQGCDCVGLKGALMDKAISHCAYDACFPLASQQESGCDLLADMYFKNADKMSEMTASTSQLCARYRVGFFAKQTESDHKCETQFLSADRSRNLSPDRSGWGTVIEAPSTSKTCTTVVSAEAVKHMAVVAPSQWCGAVPQSCRIVHKCMVAKNKDDPIDNRLIMTPDLHSMWDGCLQNLERQPPRFVIYHDARDVDRQAKVLSESSDTYGTLFKVPLRVWFTEIAASGRWHLFRGSRHVGPGHIYAFHVYHPHPDPFISNLRWRLKHDLYYLEPPVEVSRCQDLSEDNSQMGEDEASRDASKDLSEDDSRMSE
ncbi:hypothetical protein DIPPA_18820 [Diplonema papillatum]|nr:hypothetical protein DIPPA_18820 [Diplonema papillatum]